MNKVFVEENGVYQIDCTKALWATDAVHEIYRANKVGLKDIDFIIEQEDNILLLEYKNAAIGRAVEHGSNFDPNAEKIINNIPEKYFGRLQVQIEQDLSSNYISGIHLIKKSVEQFIRSVVA